MAGNVLGNSDIPAGCCLVAVRLNVIFSEAEETLQVSNRTELRVMLPSCSLIGLTTATPSRTIASVMTYSSESVCSKIRKVWFQLLADGWFTRDSVLCFYIVVVKIPAVKTFSNQEGHYQHFCLRLTLVFIYCHSAHLLQDSLVLNSMSCVEANQRHNI